MPKLDLETIPLVTGSSYPGKLAAEMNGRAQLRLGDAGGLTQFGANLVILAPGAKSSLRHWHEEQDEFLIVTAGNLVLIEDQGQTALSVGDCAAFPAGIANGHHVVNRSNGEGRFLVVGTRTATETGWYSDIDMKVVDDGSGGKFSYQDGSPMTDVDEDPS